MHFRHHGFLQSIIPLVGVELNAECQTPYDRGLGTGVIVMALEAISWYRNLEELLSCYVSMAQFNCLPFQGIHRSRLTQLWGNPTQAIWTDRQNFPQQKGCLLALEGFKRGQSTVLWGKLTVRGAAPRALDLESNQNLLSVSKISLNCISEDALQGSHLRVHFLLPLIFKAHFTHVRIAYRI